MKFKRLAFSLMLALNTESFLYANPEGGSVQSGDASIQNLNPEKILINQSTDKAIINWKNFNIEEGEQVQYIVPHSGSATLNRVTGNDPSHIFGQLKSNGILYLINTNGIVFGAHSRIDAAGLIASTQNISNENFNRGQNVFNKSSPYLDGRINMDGIVQVSSATDQGGEIILNAGANQVSITGSLIANGPKQGGNIQVRGENIRLGAQTKMEANATQAGAGGKIDLVANNHMEAAGSLSAHGAGLNGKGGFIETSGKNTLDFSRLTNVDTSGSAGAGTWLLDPQDITLDTASLLLIQQALANNNVTIETNNALPGQGDITLNGNLSWSSDNSLTLSAYRNINFNQSHISLSGSGNLILRADNTGRGAGKVTFSGTGPYIIMGSNASTQIFYNPTGGFSGSEKSIVGTDYYANQVSGGSLNSYMLINSASSLQSLATGAPLNGKYALAKDIDLSSIANFIPIAKSADPDDPYSTYFSGYFNGNQYTISNLNIIDTSASFNVLGLFAYINNAEVRNLYLKNVNIATSMNAFGSAVGGVAALADFSTIDNVRVDGSLFSLEGNAGGVVGMASSSTLTHLSTQVNISSTSVSSSLVGGIAGYISDTQIAYVNSHSTLSGTSTVGGIVGGVQNNSSINIASFSGSIFSADYSAGGIAASLSSVTDPSSITNTYTDAHITLAQNTQILSNEAGLGGIVGFLAGDNQILSNNVFNGTLTATGTYASSIPQGAITGKIQQSTINTQVFSNYWNSASATAGIGLDTNGYVINNPSSTTAFSSLNLTNPNTFSGLDFDTVWVMEANGPNLANTGSFNAYESSLNLTPALSGVRLAKNDPTRVGQSIQAEEPSSHSEASPVLFENQASAGFKNNCLHLAETASSLALTPSSCH